MIKITCDNCSAVMHRNTGSPEWVLGYDIETESSHGVSRSVRFLDRWDDARALQLGAIHLCSLKCRDAYVKKARVA
jgi:hypothetical protein